jgi:hypothetical protein
MPLLWRIAAMTTESRAFGTTTALIYYAYVIDPDGSA